MATTYRYDALTAQGEPLSGTIDASGEAEAREQLRLLGLSVRRFEPVAPIRAAALGSDDLIAFNEQLAQLARAGLPVEHGLRLLANDMSRGRLRSAVAALTHDLGAGLTLAAAIEKQRSTFPPLYARLIDAGVRVGNLPGVLFGLNHHLDLTRRIRSALSRAMAYPAAMLLAIVIVAAFLSAYVLPQVIAIFDEQLSRGNLAVFRWGRTPPPPPTMPKITLAALYFGRFAPALAITLTAIIAGWAVLWPIVRGTAPGRAISDSLLTRLPLIGPALRFSMIGRWCDAARLAVDSGLDLPAAFALASDTVGSRRLAADAAVLSDAVSRGRPLDGVHGLSILPDTVPAAIELAGASGNLASTLGSLAAMYLQQAEHRARLIPIILTPLLTLLIAIVIGTLMAAVFTPLVVMLRGITGS